MFGLIKDIAEIATAPIKIAEDVARTVTKPVADLSKEVVEEVKNATRDLRE